MELARDEGVHDQISWVGWLDTVGKAEAFAAADLFVLLSDAENSGLSVVEALQHDVVVVASTEVGVGVELAREEAVLLAPRDPGAAARRLDQILDDEPLRARTLASARAAVSRLVSPDRVADAYIQLSEGATDRR